MYLKEISEQISPQHSEPSYSSGFLETGFSCATTVSYQLITQKVRDLIDVVALQQTDVCQGLCDEVLMLSACLTEVLDDVVYGGLEQGVHGIRIHPQHPLRRPLHKIHTGEERRRVRSRHHDTTENSETYR